VQDALHRHNQAVKIVSHMFGVEIYARGLREMGKILELDRHLAEIAGLRYKVDRNHDVVYLELDEPTLSVREIRAIFLNLSLQPLLLARFRRSFSRERRRSGWAWEMRSMISDQKSEQG
jgi:hypothetical protein